MRILLDISHPAHAHFFRHAIRYWQDANHDVQVVSRDKDITLQLLDEFGVEHIPIGHVRGGIAGLGVELVERAWGINRVVRNFKPDVAAAIAGTFLVYGCLPKRVPVVVFYDTEHANLSNKLAYPLAKAVVTPRAYNKSVGEKQIRYSGYQELAYTHPSVFTPDPSVLELESLSVGEPFTIVRLVSWEAGHDVGRYGVKDLRELIETLSQYGRVILSSEKNPPDHLRPLILRGPRQNMLHLQAFASLFIGESPTMASECAMLGTPAIFLSTIRLGYMEEQQQRYGMVFSFNDPKTGQQDALAKAVELLSDPSTPQQWQLKHEAMLSELIDVSQFIADIVPRFARGNKPTRRRGTTA